MSTSQYSNKNQSVEIACHSACPLCGLPGLGGPIDEYGYSKLKCRCGASTSHRVRSELQLEASQPTKYYKVGESVDFTSKGSINPFRSEGWGVQEIWGRWSIGMQAKLFLPTDNFNNTPLKFFMLIRPFIAPPLHSSLLVSVIINKTDLTELELNNRDFERIEIDLDQSNFADEYEVQFRFHNSRSPKEIGVGDDSRLLGIGLKEYGIRSA
jgi:hypothetical protein